MTRDGFDSFEYSWKEVTGGPVEGTVGAINRATFSFWRNTWIATWDLLFPKSMSEVYYECSTIVEQELAD